MVPMGAVIVVTIIGKTKIPPIYFLFIGSILEVIGTAGLSQTPNHFKIWKLQYLFQFIAGAGVGCFNGTLTLIAPFAFSKKDLGKYFKSPGLNSTKSFRCWYCFRRAI